jgi:hypothetical protein
MQGKLIRAQSAYNRGFKMLVLMLQVMLSYNQLMVLDHQISVHFGKAVSEKIF